MNDRTIGDGNRIKGVVQSLTQEEKNQLFANLYTESFGKTLLFSAEAGKSLVCINGGAAVAMLAFCGNYIAETTCWSMIAIICFAIGSLLGVLVLYSAYMAQGRFTDMKKEEGHRFNTCAFILAILAMILFVSGITFSAIAINRLQQQKANRIESPCRK